MYMIYVVDRGWVTSSGQFNSDPQYASKYSREPAIELSKLFTRRGEVRALPIRVEDFEQIK